MNLWPRKKHKPEMIADLDAMVSESFAFMLHGKERVVKPIDVDVFFKYTNAYAELMNRTNDDSKSLSSDQLVRMYKNLFCSVSDDINEADIRKMSQSQIAALFQLISDSVTGKSHVDKKKTIARATQMGMENYQMDQSSTPQ